MSTHDTAELSPTQRELAVALLNASGTDGEPVPATGLAERVDRHPGTVRQRMGVLTSLGLAVGVAGVGGGYVPTERAYAVFDRRPEETTEQLTVAHGYERLSATVDTLAFTTVQHPDRCRVRVSFRSSVDRFDAGDPVVFGPTPAGGLVVVGSVASARPGANELLVDVDRLHSPLESDDSAGETADTPAVPAESEG